MINAGEAFANAVSKTSRHFRLRVYDGSNVVAGSVRSAVTHLGSTGPDTFAVGAVYSSYAEIVLDGRETTLEGKELRLDVGILTDSANDTYADLTLGYFTALAPAATKYRTTFTAVGRITSRLAVTEFTAPAVQTIQAVANAISRLTGVQVEFESGIDTSGVIEHPITGNCRDALSVLAGVVFGYATETNTGTVKIHRFSCIPTVQCSADHMTALPELTEINFKITGIQAVTETGSYETGNPINVTIDNNYVTEDLFDTFAGNLIGIEYRPGSVPLALGDPRIEPSDTLQISVDDEIYIVPCFSIIHTFDGGLQTEIITPAEQEIGEIVGTMSAEVKEAIKTAREAAEQADDARKVAVNYLSRDSTGIMVADLNDGNQTPSTATGENVHIDNSSVNIRNGQTVLAKISAALARIGAEAAKHLDITSAGVYLYSAASTLLSSFTASAVSLYINGVLRTALTAAGLKIYDTDGSTQLASFGETTQIGKTSSGSNNMLIDSNGLHVRSGTTDLTLIEADRMQIGKSSGKNLLVDPDFGVYLRNKSSTFTWFNEDKVQIGKDGTPQAIIQKEVDNSVEINAFDGTNAVAGIRYNATAAGGYSGEVWGDYMQAQNIFVQERRAAYSSFIDVMGNNGGRIQLRAYTNAGLYSPNDEKWLIYIKPDGGVVIPSVVGDFTVDKSDSESTGTARVSAVGGAGGWEAAGKVSLMASAAGNKGLYDDDNETYIIYKGTDGVVHVDGKVLGAASTQAVANNLTTTTAGSVLDARQGKALNDKLTVDSQEFKAANYAKLSASCYARRVGRVGLLYISTLTGLTASAETTLFTIPAEYRPATAVSQDCLVAGATPACVRITINTNGSVTAYNYSTSTGTRNMRCTIPYVCAGS